MFFQAFTPKISARPGLTGRISPLKPCFCRNRCGREVVRFSSDEAPIKAMRCGEKRESKRLMARVYSGDAHAPPIDRRIRRRRPAGPSSGTGGRLAEQADQARG